MELPDITSSFLGWRELWSLKRDTLATYAQWRERFGEAMQFRLGPIRNCVFFSPQAIGQVLKLRPAQVRREPRMMRVLRQWNGEGVLVSEGQAWLQQRRLLAPAFQPQHVSKYAAILVETVEAAFPGPVSELDTAPAMVDLAIRMFCASVFDLRSTASLAPLRAALSELARALMLDVFLPFPLPVWLPIPIAQRKRRAIETLRSFVEQLIAERQLRRGDDLLSALVAAADEGQRLAPTQLRDQVMTLLLAGHDTTAAGLTWLIYFLAEHPQVAERVAEEGRTLPDRPSPSDLGKLVYTERVVKETLRLFPPAPALLLRQPLEEREIGGYRVPRGALIHLPSMIVQRDARFFPEPERFDPDRFLPGVERPEFAYLPFGAGPRICLGLSLAMLEMTLTAALLARRFRIRLRQPEGRPRPELRFTLWPQESVKVSLEPRS